MGHPIFVHVAVFLKNPFIISLLILTHRWLIAGVSPRQLVDLSESGRYSTSNYRCLETWFPVMGWCLPPSSSHSWPIRCPCNALDQCIPRIGSPYRLASLTPWLTKPLLAEGVPCPSSWHRLNEVVDLVGNSRLLSVKIYGHAVVP